MSGRIRLGVNIDHVATLRQARGTEYPDIVDAALAAEAGGADSITVHLREDRRHIQTRDVERLLPAVQTGINFEMGLTEEMRTRALDWRPMACCVVPERREELTTEGGLDVCARVKVIAAFCEELRGAGVRSSLFVDPDAAQIDAASDCGADAVELHTGDYANRTGQDQRAELERIASAADQAAAHGLEVHAGHGLHMENVSAVAAIEVIEELNIGHALIARAVFVGLEQAVREMRDVVDAARP